MQYSAITTWAKLIWDALEFHGIAADSIFKQAGLDPVALDNPNGRYPVSGMIKLWDLSSKASGDPCFGLVVAEQWRPTTWHGLGFAWLASATLEDAYRRLARYSAIFTTAADISVEEQIDTLSLAVGAQQGIRVRPTSVMIDAFVSIVIHMSRVIYGDDFRPVRVQVTHDGGECREKRRDYFGTTVDCDAARNVIEVCKVVAREALSSSNADLARANENVIRNYLARMVGGPLAVRVREQLVKDLSSGRACARSVGGELFMSSRTLQRKLAEEGTTFKEILEDTRRDLAARLIGDKTMTLSEISYLLGYSEVSAFSRSFRRWTGRSPTEYRGRF